MLDYIELAQKYAVAKGLGRADISIGMSRYDAEHFAVTIRIGEVVETESHVFRFTDETMSLTTIRTHDNPWIPSVETLKSMFRLVDQYMERRAMAVRKATLECVK